MSQNYKSKTIATWLALLLGSFGLHRFYLYGLSDKWGWLHPWPTLVGLYGVQRMDLLGQDDRLAWILIPILGLMLVNAAITGIVYGLSSDADWNAKHNPDQTIRPSGWAVIIAVIACVMMGGICLMSTIAFSAQRYFENQVESPASADPTNPANSNLPNSK
ncbi:TM2 domain-containing protein [Paucibacter sp. Y2R2-4]|uniref:TM2 domain-containing protein n=1 Tax=Paucibacter sp. Y2R2-4 TaxID=2893553 RepID=UPI0021E46ED6|nr:TM2 domain-containing protein [Paucibacter sp. Y2R2-4]MCV2352083.1 TM2 domain-containing protein [Paucibacter sp. Y2R2-4]